MEILIYSFKNIPLGRKLIYYFTHEVKKLFDPLQKTVIGHGRVYGGDGGGKLSSQ